jgi:predicted  nucleic acid-binding Zn-ribbon protein
LKEQLARLRQLQTVDSNTEEIRQQIKALPERLVPAKQDLARLQALLAAERTKLAETETWRAEQEETIRNESDAVKNAKVKLASAKNAREFAMANREIDNKRRSISSREEEVLKVIDAMEKTREALSAQEAQVNEIAEKLAAEEAAVIEKVAELEARAVESMSGRDEIASQIDPDLLKKYETVMKKRGLAMVPVIDGSCGGCHVRVPPQLNNILAAGESLETCPACYRLLYHASLLEEPAES